MSNKVFNELKNLTKDELATKIRALEAEIFKSRMAKATGQLKDTAMLWRYRKSLARMKMLYARPEGSK